MYTNKTAGTGIRRVVNVKYQKKKTKIFFCVV